MKSIISGIVRLIHVIKKFKQYKKVYNENNSCLLPRPLVLFPIATAVINVSSERNLKQHTKILGYWC